MTKIINFRFGLNQKQFSRNLTIMIIAFIIDMIWGDPKNIYKKIPHPVSWIGKLIHLLDQQLNKQNKLPKIQKRNGFIALFTIITLPGFIAYILQKLIFAFFRPNIAFFISGILGSIFIAQRSLYEHVDAVKKKLEQQDLPQARIAVSQIVGRETKNLGASEICCAAIESLAENFSDGVIAPIFWGCIGGLPGIVIFKSINTADSMIGHFTQKYRYFGYASAKTDDYVNFIPARLSALLILFANCQHMFHRLKSIRQDAKKHNSPNAGWPESAMARVLNIQFICPRHYQEHSAPSPKIGQGRHQLFPQDIQKACSVFNKACLINILLMILIKMQKS